MDLSKICMPVDALLPFYTGVRSYLDLPEILRQQVAHFFEHYKDLEQGKWTRIGRWLDVAEAEQLIMEAITRAAA
ncbi:MAG: inorganic diphosphatase [Hyphomicrobiales bacterium]|nr:inorganic diphosphatase [Hyphomicrobiales bacterium]